MTTPESSKALKGTVFDIKEFSIHDGPGLRTTIFLKGCPLRCVWCHNPEGLSPRPEISYKKNVCIGCLECQKECSHDDCKPFGRCLHVCPKNALSVIGKEYTDNELLEKLLKNYDIIKDGGVTFSGGEP
ncbi:MAG: 4Fe-4S cluster-binding domain-containing protein, partial [Clostridia bacterium]|nr:4Fe-4S cluster-binding domain-containing protein [Clostridia bacterium]